MYVYRKKLLGNSLAGVLFICYQLQSIAWTDMSLVDRSSLPIRVTACVKCTNLVFPGRACLSLHVAQDQLYWISRADYAEEHEITTLP